MSNAPSGSLLAELKTLGCSDHNCVVSRPVGMGTNGGCHCLPSGIPLIERVRLRRAFAIYRLLLEREPQ